MKNNIKKSLSIIICLFFTLVSGCRKDFLERAPSDLIDEGKVFSNIENAEAFLNNAYNDVPQLLYRNPQSSWFNLGAATDESANMLGHNNTSTAFNSGNWNAVMSPLGYLWKKYYGAIRRINIFLNNYEKIPDEVSGQAISDRKKRMLGEAYGLRAYFHFLLFQMYGEIPLINTVLTPGGSEDVRLVRSSLPEVISFISEDLQRAIDLLPARHNDANFGRITSTAARAIRSRLYLYYASTLFNPTNDKSRWELAAEYAKEAIDFSLINSYSLSQTSNGTKRSYERIFLEMNCPEVLWSAGNPIDGNGGTWDSWAESLGNNGWYSEAPVQELVDSYEMTNGELPLLGYNPDGSQIINPKAGYNPNQPYINRDPRLDQTVLYHGANWKGRKINVAPGGADFDGGRPRVNYFWRKYILEDRNLFTGSGFAPRRFILFRLAEVYLNYAEALNESLSTPSNEVFEAIKMIRGREGVNMPDLPTNLSTNEVRERIRRERRVEFAFENQRFWDVRRWKIAEVVDNRPVHKVDVSSSGIFSYRVFNIRNFDRTRHYLMPIPQTEIDKSQGTLVQNPNW